MTRTTKILLIPAFIIIASVVGITILNGKNPQRIAEPTKPPFAQTQNQKPDTSKQSLPKSPPTKTANLNAIPPLPPQFTWNKLSPSEATDLYRRISVTKNPNIFAEEAVLEGEVWVAELKQVNSNNFDPDKDLFGYYQSKLQSAGWSWDVESAGYRLNAVDADGPNGSITGHIGIDKNQLRVVNFSYKVTSFDEKTLVRDAKYWVFISDITTLEDILTQL